MLLRKKDYRMKLGIGQLAGVLGMIGMSVSGAFGNASVFSLFIDHPRWLDFMNGFLIGVSSAMFGISVVLTIAGLASISKITTNAEN